MDFYGYSRQRENAFRITPENNAPEQASFTTTMTWQMVRRNNVPRRKTKNFTVTLKRGEGRPSPEAGSLVRGLVGLSTLPGRKACNPASPRREKPSSFI